jgi:pimeloyl-ACP methyl ester carboxylesterase
MTVVFVHGVPETALIWQRAIAGLDQPAVALSLPGFASARPAGFTATKDAYADWLAAQLRARPGPVDLVGHDWGALLTIRIATAYDVPLRSWVADVANGFHPNYLWHRAAQAWQTPEAGERVLADWLAMPADDPGSIAGVLRAHGSPPTDATTMAAALDATTLQCMLDLYSSAVPNLNHSWGQDLALAASPGLVVVPTGDRFNDEHQWREVAATLGAEVALLPGLHHGWMSEDPDTAVAMLTTFWSHLAPPGA